MLAGLLGLFLFSACTRHGDAGVDRLNDLAYTYHYRNIDSVSSFALKALALAAGYPSGRAEAYNNLAFADIAQMDYGLAAARLDSALAVTDNQVEQLVADVQHMRLCQRQSRNKDFYYYRERAIRRIRRIEEEKDGMDCRMKQRYVYARTEYLIVSSTYYYYVGLQHQSAEAMKHVDPAEGIQSDTAQYAAYLYQIGSGGILGGKQAATAQREFEYLMKCYVLAKRSSMVYWQANALQAISEHLLDRTTGLQLARDNKAALAYINDDNMPDSLLAGYFAQRALNMFKAYGDVYQIAGAYRTLAQCYFALGDYHSSLICLENALYTNKTINRAPDLVASIRECLSMVYSAMNDKNNSDINRNAYLDIQEYTRQDRQLEARAEQLERTSRELNWLIVAILMLVAAVCVLMYVLNKRGKHRRGAAYLDNLLAPLRDWEQAGKKEDADLDNRLEELIGQLSLTKLQLEKDKRRTLDNKAKVFLASSIMPLIDRIINEAARLKNGNDAGDVHQARLAYMAELAGKIGEYNAVLTHWIQLRQGHLDLHIESFALQDVFAILSKSGMSFSLKGISLEVEQTDAVVKADKALTVFMLNTLADNARKFTQKGGTVNISAVKAADYVEISVSDTGIGMSESELSGIFSHKITNGHGFGLMNCKGIIDRYKKTSRIFNVCSLSAESVKGRGSRFYFRLPYGVMRVLLALLLAFTYSVDLLASNGAKLLREAGSYADSAYYCNLSGSYERTLAFADSARICLNRYYLSLHPGGKHLMVATDNGAALPAELQWLLHKVMTDYDIILDIRNESAVAALALHRWDLYEYNNMVYTRLFKERSADNKGLEKYCLTMQAAGTNKTVAVVVLVVMLAAAIFAFYFLYYRRVLYYRLCADNIRNVNKILLSTMTDEEKLDMISTVDTSKYPEELNGIMMKIKTALQYAVKHRIAKRQSIEFTADELRRVSYEKDKLHVCNNVIDNGLSTLKHETMYYPSQISRLLLNSNANLDSVSEVVAYYKDLYSILCKQVKRQADAINFECKPVPLKSLLGTDIYVLGDKALIVYLFDVLKRQCQCTYSSVTTSSLGSRYLTIEFTSNETKLTEGQCRELFSPAVRNIPFMICRQVLREIAEQTNLHGCGITVKPLASGGISINLVFAKPAI